jgi:HEAT repeat protein
MNSDNYIEQDILEVLKSDKTMLKTEVLCSLVFEEVDTETLKTIIQLITDNDKSLKNAASNFLIHNNNPNISSAILDYTSSSDISVRNLASEILLRKGSASLEAICKKLPEIKDDDVIKFLVDILGLIGNKIPEDLIIDILHVNQNENVIVACIEALGNINSEKGVEHIIPFYEFSDILKPVVIEAIGKISTQTSRKFITEKFNCNDDFLTFIMIESLGEIGDEDSFYFLISQIDSLSGTLIWPLLEAINKLKIKYNLDVPFDEKIKKCVLDAILNSEPEYQLIAAHLVTVFDDPEILHACLSIYGIEQELNEVLHGKFMQNKKVIISKIHTVIDNSNKYLSTVLELLQNIHSSQPDIINCLTQIEKQRITESLSKSLTNPDEVVRIVAAELLFKIDCETALLFLDSMINDENFWNRIRLLDIITDIDSPEIMDALFKLVNDPEEMVSEKAKEITLLKQHLFN